MKVAEDSLDPNAARANELISFAKEAGYKTIGIANCITFEKEAEFLKEQIEKEGFKVVRSHCKLGRMRNGDILPGYKGISCNPAGQAETMNKATTDMNVVMGLCLGHDIVFQNKSKAPSTTLVVKDRKLKHNPVEYFK
jgi:uncharacterized metal-binding protein